MEFLFDDEWVDRKAGVHRVLGRPCKEPIPFHPEMPWERAGIDARHALLFDEEAHRFKLWYHAEGSTGDDGAAVTDSGTSNAAPSSERTRRGKQGFICYAESEDGLRWERPSLGRFRFEESRANNILMECGDFDGVMWNVARDPDDPDPRRGYKALGFSPSVESALRDVAPGERGVCVAYSPDGLGWTPPKLVMSTGDLTDADCLLGHREPTSGRWVLFARPRTSPKRRFIGYSVSDDFDHWTYPRMLLTPDAQDDEWTEFYGLTVACVGRNGGGPPKKPLRATPPPLTTEETWWRVGCLWVFHNNPDVSPMTTELVYSRGGLHYRRAMPRVEFLPLGPEGAPDSRMIRSVALIERGAEHLLFYQGSNRDHGSDRGQSMPPGRLPDGEEPQSVIGVARIPWGQFCGLHAAHDGMVESKWLCNYGASGVQAVAAVEPGGWIRAEILDPYGSIIPGWDRDASLVRAETDGRLRFSWARDDLTGIFRQVSDAGGRIGHAIKLRFHLHRATLFGFQAGEQGAGPQYEV